MFTIVEEMGKLNLKNGNQTIFPDITVWITQQGQSSMKLERKSVTSFTSMGHLDATDSCMNYECVFVDDQEIAAVTVTFQCEEKFVACNVDAKLQSEATIKGYRFFNATDSVMLKAGALENIDGLMATYQHKDWWTRPTFCHDVRKLPSRTQTLLWKFENSTQSSSDRDSYYYLLPVCGEEFRSEIRGDEQGIIVTHATFNGGHTECRTLSFVLGTASDPISLVRQTTRHTMQKLNNPVQLREDKSYPEILEYLGWCSWDAFYHKVNAEGLQDKADELKAKDVPVKWFMIDDGWLNVQNERLHAFSADAEKFPTGLGTVVQRLKHAYGVRWVGVWHTLFGYWGGVNPDSPLAAEFSQSLLRTNAGRLVPSPDGVSGFGFWNSWHSQLKRQGIDFVKVDGQSGVKNFLEQNRDIGQAARVSHISLESSTSLHFGNQVINCMGMAAENIWNRPYSAVSRNSDDFVPDVTGSFKEHALQNAYNSLFHSQFYWGDWDMFWTTHPQSRNNALLRAVSGGPVYFSDRVGETDASELMPLVLENGRIIRCDEPGLPTIDCLFHSPVEEPVPLKVWSRLGGAGVIAVFHVYEKSGNVTGSISPSDILGLSGERFALVDYFRRTVMVLDKHESMELSLADNEYGLYYVLPVSEKMCTPLGLLNKYIALGTITRELHLFNRTVVELTEGGEFGFVSHEEPVSVLVNGEQWRFAKSETASNLYTIECWQAESPVLIEIIYN